jgi:WD domain, G-beta repeat
MNTNANRTEFSLLPSRGARFQMRLDQLKSSPPCCRATQATTRPSAVMSSYSEKDDKENREGAAAPPPPAPSSSSSSRPMKALSDDNDDADGLGDNGRCIPDVLSPLGDDNGLFVVDAEPGENSADDVAPLGERETDPWNTSFSLIPSRNTHLARKLQRLKASHHRIGSRAGAGSGGMQCNDGGTASCSVGIIGERASDGDPDSDRSRSCGSLGSACADDAASPVMAPDVVETQPKRVAVDDDADATFDTTGRHPPGQRLHQDVPIIPATVLLGPISSFLGDRSTWNAVATLNREVHNLSRVMPHLYRPWPRVRWRVASGRAWSVAFGTNYLCCGTDQGTMLVWMVHGFGSAKSLDHNAAGGQQQQQPPEPGSGSRINTIQCHGDWIVSAGDNRLARVWNVLTWSCEVVLEGHASSIASVSILPKDDGTSGQTDGPSSSTSTMWIATASLDSDIRLYAVSYEDVRVTSSECLRTFVGSHNGPVYSVVMYEREGESFLFSGGLDERLRLWDLSHCAGENDDSQSEQVQGIEGSKCILRTEGEIRSISVSQDQQRIAASFGRSVFHCNLHDWSLRPDHHPGAEHDPGLVVVDGCYRDGWSVLKGHSSNIRCIDFSPDGRLVASACSDGTIRLWTLGEGTWKRKWKAHNGFMVSNLAFSPDGMSLLSVGSDGTIAIEKL